MWRSAFTCESLRREGANLRYSRDDNENIFLMTNMFDLTVMHSQENFYC